MKKFLKWFLIVIAIVLVLIIVAGAGLFFFVSNAMRGSIATPPAAGSDHTLVQTLSGAVRGYINNDIYIYHGIPYAQATERFVPAQPYTWDDVLDAVQYGPIAMQGGASSYSDGTGKAAMDNNCQNLNIWTPSIAEGEALPVMVWLHSGSFSSGSSSTDPSIDGTSLSKEGNVVVVSINHRLNVMGFLDLSAYGEKYQDSANVGMMDLVMALEWIQENIAQFGGDPNNVTIFGESGGGAKVLALMTTPYAKGLFHKAINQSGILDSSGVTYTSAEASARVAEITLETLGITSENIEDIQTIDYAALTEASDAAMQQTAQELQLYSLGAIGMQWLPTIDGDLLPTSPVTEDGFAETGRDIPLLVGTNLAELTGFGALMEGKNSLTEEDVLARLTETYGDRAQDILDAFKEAYPNKHVADVLYIDTIHRQPALKVLYHKIAQGGAPVYGYVFTWESTLLPGRIMAMHTMEVPFVFHNVEQSLFAGDNELARALEEKMSQAWINFAWTGDPSTDALEWPAFDMENGATMIFDNETYVGYYHDKELLELLDPDYEYFENETE